MEPTFDTQGTGVPETAALPHSPRRRLSRRLLVLAAGTALVALTIGGSVALAASPSPSSTGTPGSVDPTAADAAFAKFAACMRDHGIDMPDPVTVQGTTDAGPTTLSTAGGAPGDDKAFQAANDACKSILADAGIDTSTSTQTVTGNAGTPGALGAAGAMAVIGVGVAGGDVTAAAADMKAYAACMRTHGVDLPDPVVDSAAGTVQLSVASDPGSDAFQAANTACSTGTVGFPAPPAPGATTAP